MRKTSGEKDEKNWKRNPSQELHHWIICEVSVEPNSGIGAQSDANVREIEQNCHDKAEHCQKCPIFSYSVENE